MMNMVIGIAAIAIAIALMLAVLAPYLVEPNYAGVAQREHPAPGREVAGSTPAPRSKLTSDDVQAYVIWAATVVIAIALVALALGGAR